MAHPRSDDDPQMGPPECHDGNDIPLLDLLGGLAVGTLGGILWVAGPRESTRKPLGGTFIGIGIGGVISAGLGFHWVHRCREQEFDFGQSTGHGTDGPTR